VNLEYNNVRSIGSLWPWDERSKESSVLVAAASQIEESLRRLQVDHIDRADLHLHVPPVSMYKELSLIRKS
jgi:hypothetical protein